MEVPHRSRYLLHVQFIIAIISNLLITASAQIPIHVITGIKFEEISTTIPYHSTTQLVYKIPHHNKVTSAIPKLKHTTETCKNLLNETLQNCEDRKTLETLQDNIHDILNLNEKNLDPELKITKNNRRKRAIDFIGSGLHWCCNVATSDNLEELSQNELQVDGKLNNLLDYVKQENHDLIIAENQMNNFSSNLNTVLQNLHSSLTQYDTTFKANMDTSARRLETKLQKFTQESWLYIYLSLYYNKISRIEDDCQNNKIPQDLVPIRDLQEDLIKLQNKISRQNLSLAVSYRKAYHLYNLPIAKCSFSNGSIVLQVNVPLQISNTSYQTYTYNPIPLKWENNICTLANDNFLIITANNQTYIVDKNNNPHCDHVSSNLCLIPRFSYHSSLAAKCAKFLIKGTSLNKLKDYCEFHCVAAPDHTVVTQLKVNQFLITNTLNELDIICEDDKLTSKIPKIEIGTVELNLPCNCKVMNQNEIIIDTTSPCDKRDFSNPAINHLIPLTWTNLDNLKIDPFDLKKRTEFDNITKFIMPNWNITTPTFLVKNLEKATIFEHIIPKAHWADITDNKLMMIYGLSIWCTCVTLLLFIAIYKIHIINVKLAVIRQPPLPMRDFSQ